MEPVIDSIEQTQVIVYDEQAVILRGVSQVLTANADMDGLRRRSGQQHDVSTDLLLILSRHNSHHRTPLVVLLRIGGTLSAAVIFAERCVLGVGPGLLRAGDPVGDGAVIAPARDRRSALLAAMDTLLRQRRFHTIAATLSGVDLADVPAHSGTYTVSACRIVRRYLPLSPTFEETLRLRFTPRKRKNLLYNIRSLSKAHAIDFVPNLSLADAQSAILQLAQLSWPFRTAEEIARHCDFLRRHPQSFCMGLRLKEGPWLSLITGWRMDGITHMPWQLNHDGYKDYSLMQVMRTYLLEHECALSQSALSWVGGTVAFQTACEPELCLDVLKSRDGIRGTLLRRVVAPFLFQRDPDALLGGSLMLLLPPEDRAPTGGLDTSA